MNPLWGGINIAAFAGEVIATLANNSMYTYELSPMATLIEQALIKRMCEMVGFPDGNGTLTTGGSNGNMIGMMCARYTIDPLGQQRGFDSRNLVSFVSEESHYSVLMAANVLGIGFDNVIKVPCDSDGRMRVDKLEEEINRSRVNGQIPFCKLLPHPEQQLEGHLIRCARLQKFALARRFGFMLTLLGVDPACLVTNYVSLWME